MPSQKFGDGKVVLQFLQRLVKLRFMRILEFSANELSVLHSPSGALDRQQRQPRFAQQAVRDGRLAMDEFGTALCWVPELGSVKRMDAPSASVPRFQDR